MFKALYELRKALIGVTPMRDAADKLEEAMHAKAQATAEQEAAEFESEKQALIVRHSQRRIDRLVNEITAGALNGQLKKGELKMVKPLIGEAIHDKSAEVIPMSAGQSLVSGRAAGHAS